MCPAEDHDSGDGDRLLDEAIAEFLRFEEDGVSVDREEFLAKHSSLADGLQDFFQHRDRMNRLLDPVRSAANRVLNVRCPHCRNAIELVDHAEVSSISCPVCGSDFSLVHTTNTERRRELQRIGQFQLLEEVGAGQFGSVWKARDLTLERLVAVKIPRYRHLDSTESELFLRDARLSAQLRHPNIVRIHEVGKHENTLYIISDFIHGATLESWLKTKPITVSQTVEMAIKIAEALHHAHEEGVIHRDLKPSNVIIDLANEPHLVDFGLAKRDSGEVTMTVDGQILGTPAYMSPEQASGQAHKVDRTADVYSLGVLFFEMLTGERPFRGDKRMLLAQIVTDDPPGPRQINSTVPRALEVICLKCLRKEPSKRYATAQAFKEDLQRWQENKPIVAKPVSRFERAALWCRRRPAITALTALLLLVTLGAWGVSHQIQQRERANGLLNRLLSAEYVDADEFAEELLPYRQWVMQDLEAAFAGSDQQRKLLACTALFKLDATEPRLDFLCEQMVVDSHPDQFQLTFGLLAPYSDRIRERLWERALDAEGDTAARFKACAALATFDPDNESWDQIADFTADYLVGIVPTYLSMGQRSMVPVKERLMQPLFDLMRNRLIWIRKQNFAADTLTKYANDKPASLFQYLQHSSNQQFEIVFPVLLQHETEFEAMLEESLTQTLEGFTLTESRAEQLAILAIAAHRLGRHELAAPILCATTDPGARSQFVRRAARYSIAPQTLLEQIDRNEDPSIRAALVLALGEHTIARFSSQEREECYPTLLALYCEDPSSNLHSAVGWLLRHWGYSDELSKVDKKLQAPSEAATREWYVTSQNQTMIVVPAGEFDMGAAENTPFDFDKGELAGVDRPQRRVRIERTFAIGSTEITRHQWAAFVAASGKSTTATSDQSPTQRPQGGPSHPQDQISWFGAAAYCNWLSEQEGIPREQWAYEPNDDGEYAEGMRVASRFPNVSGYRLPTEAEWEFACRAGSSTYRHYGSSSESLSYYEACQHNSARGPSIVGSFKPNGLGLFDTLGNLSEWCHDRGRRYPSGTGSEPVPDLQQAGAKILGPRVVRGGAFGLPDNRLDPADRGWVDPATTDYLVGFRVARTIVAAPYDRVPHSER